MLMATFYQTESSSWANWETVIIINLLSVQHNISLSFSTVVIFSIFPLNQLKDDPTCF